VGIGYLEKMRTYETSNREKKQMVNIYLVSAIPNSFLTRFQKTHIHKLEESLVLRNIAHPDFYQDYDDTTAPYRLHSLDDKHHVQTVVAIGHDSTAQLISKRLTKYNGSFNFQPIPFEVKANRIEINLKPSDIVVACVFVPPRRLTEGEVWKEEEILAMPIEWLKITFED
jgi:hypothetical protein